MKQEAGLSAQSGDAGGCPKSDAGKASESWGPAMPAALQVSCKLVIVASEMGRSHALLHRLCSL